MNKKLEQQLIDKYPKLFRQVALPITQSCMGWGLECGQGWYHLIERLCRALQWDIDKNNHEQMEFSQIKEKFGSLRIYTDGADERQEGMITMVEYLSEWVCEDCGMPGVLRKHHGWFRTTCDVCEEKCNED